MATTWIVVADAGHAKIMSCRGLDYEHAHQVQVFSNGSAQHHDRDLTTDKGGNRREMGKIGRQNGQGGFHPGGTGDYQQAKTHAKEVFAHKLAEFLSHAHNDQAFTNLELIAAPEFLGLLRQQLDPQIKKLIVQEFDKDLSHESGHALKKHLAQLHAA